MEYIMDDYELDIRGMDLRLLNVYADDINNRVKDLTALVVLQENELTIMWFTIIGLFGYILLKGNKWAITPNS
jgi:hypothetical protein